MRFLKTNRFRTIIFVFFCISLGCSKQNERIEMPVITSVAPHEAPSYQTLTINGTGFFSRDSNSMVKVFFANKTVSGFVKDKNTIEVQVPFDAGSGPVCVEINNKRICSNDSFDYIPGNPDHNTYMRLADCPTAAIMACIASKNSVIAVGGPSCWRYDIKSNKWEQMVAPTESVIRCATFDIRGEAYVFGGLIGTYEPSNHLQCYNPEKNSWSFKAELPSIPRWDAVAFVWKNKAYIAGGTDSDVRGFNTIYNEVWQYDPETNSWKEMSKMPEGVFAKRGYALRIGDKFYFPSMSGSGPQEYDPETDTWRQLWFANNLNLYGTPFSDDNFAIGYVIGGRGGSIEMGWLNRYAIDYTGNNIFVEEFKNPPENGYKTVSEACYASVNGEFYYGMGYFDASGMYSGSTQFWRYKP